jgi:hypothetical protein
MVVGAGDAGAVALSREAALQESVPVPVQAWV